MTISNSRLMNPMILAGLAVILTGCTSAGGTRPLAFGPVSSARVASSDTILAALNGGILPKQAVDSLPRGDRLRALEAEYQALEKTPLGQKVAWRSPNSGALGEVTAGTPYQVGQQNCRQYTHSATISGALVTGQGAACRNADGSWTTLG